MNTKHIHADAPLGEDQGLAHPRRLVKHERVHIDVAFELRMVVYPAGDIKDTWIAHSLDFDVVSQGKSQQDAIAMLELAFDELVDYRIFLGLPPVAPKPAPEEVWKLAEAAFGEQLSRKPVSVWLGSKKSETHTKPGGGTAPRTATYISQHPPTLHACAV